MVKNKENIQNIHKKFIWLKVLHTLDSKAVKVLNIGDYNNREQLQL